MQQKFCNLWSQLLLYCKLAPYQLAFSFPDVALGVSKKSRLIDELSITLLLLLVIFEDKQFSNLFLHLASSRRKRPEKILVELSSCHKDVESCCCF